MNKILLIGIIGLIFWSCNPKPSGSDLFKNYAVYTDNYGTNFSQYSKYYLSIDTLAYVYNVYDTIGQCVQCGGSQYQSFIPSNYIDITTSEVNTNLENGHFTKVEWNQNPDLQVFISIAENYSETYYSGGYYYGSYPSVSVSDQWVMWIYLIDINKEAIVWQGNISDLSATQDADGSLLIAAINKAFQQAPVVKNP